LFSCFENVAKGDDCANEFGTDCPAQKTAALLTIILYCLGVFTAIFAGELGSLLTYNRSKSSGISLVSAWYQPEENQVKVEMLAPGRLNGSVWWLDGNDFVK
jgi:hypothetical protein